METITTKLEILNEAKEAIKVAIKEKGVPISASDSFKSYADRIRLIQGNSEGSVRILRAFVPSYFKGSTALNSTILLNPASYYHNIQESGEIESGLNAFSYANIYTLFISEYVIGLFSRSSGYVNVSFRNDDGSLRPFILNNSFNSIFKSYNFLKGVYVSYDTDCVFFKVEDEKIVPYANTPNSSYTFDNGSGKAVYFIGDNYFFIPGYYNGYLKISRFNKRDFSFVETKLTNLSGTNTVLDAYIMVNDDNVFIQRNNMFQKINYLNNTMTNYSVEESYITTYYTDKISSYDGSYYIANNSGNLKFIKAKKDLNGNFYFIEDIQKSIFLNDLLGVVTPGRDTSHNIQPQINNDIYFNSTKGLKGVHYDKVTDELKEIVHPCTLFADKKYILRSAFVSIADGFCALFRADSNLLYSLQYAKLEKTDLGDLNWVAYEPVKANYTPQSITTQSLNITGTDEKGNHYVDVKALLPSNDLGDYLKPDNGDGS